MKRTPEEKEEGEYLAQERGWEARRLAATQMHASWSPLVHTRTVA